MGGTGNCRIVTSVGVRCEPPLSFFPSGLSIIYVWIPRCCVYLEQVV